jgi:DNA-binding PadR family transcriptional regulator
LPWVSLWPYSTTTRKNDRDRIVIHFDDDQESRDEILESLARLVAAGHVERVSALVDGKPEVQYVITAEGRRRLRALQES